VKLTPEEDELARRARSNWAFDSTKLRKGVAAAIRRGDEAMAAAEPKGIPAYRAVREWDNIPDDELIEVYHATSVETAEKMVREGIRVAEKPQGVFDPDKVDPGLFVGDSPERVRRYGRLAGGGGADSPHRILAVTVRQGGPEGPITETAGALQTPTVPQVLTRPNVGATIKKDLPPSAFRILDEDAVARASEFDELVKERGRIGMEKYDLERARDWGLEYDEDRLRELTEQYDDLTRRMNEVTTTSRPSAAVSADVAQRVDALVKWWQANAEPQTGLVRALNADEVKALRGKTVGDTVEIEMASSDIGGLFADVAHKEALGGGGGWRYEFAPDTKAAFNELNQIEPNRAAMAGLKGGGEYLVSGRFTIESIDEANKVVKLKNQENILPYAPPPSKKTRVLKGYDELVAAGAMPTRVVKNVVKNKFKTVDDAKKIVELVARGRDKFHAMREFPQDAAQPDTALLRYLSQPTETIRDGWHKTDYAYGSAPGVGLHTYYDDAGEPIFVAAVESGISGRTVAVSHLRELTGREGLRVAHRLFEKLDELVDEGVLELSYNSVINMVENTSM